MSTFLNAPPYDPRRDRMRRNAAIIVVVVVVLAVVGYLVYPRYMARRTVNHFMTALENKNYQEAYYIWQANPKLYPMDVFMGDWGPNSKWGIIKTYHIEKIGVPPGGHASGLVALVEVNGIASDEARIWIQNGTRELSFYQF